MPLHKTHYLQANHATHVAGYFKVPIKLQESLEELLGQTEYIIAITARSGSLKVHLMDGTNKPVPIAESDKIVRDIAQGTIEIVSKDAAAARFNAAAAPERNNA